MVTMLPQKRHWHSIPGDDGVIISIIENLSLAVQEILLGGQPKVKKRRSLERTEATLPIPPFVVGDTPEIMDAQAQNARSDALEAFQYEDVLRRSLYDF